jgi:hypothetical protein
VQVVLQSYEEHYIEHDVSALHSGLLEEIMAVKIRLLVAQRGAAYLYVV